MPVFGLSETHLKRSLAVARKAYSLAIRCGAEEMFARKIFLLGLLADVGIEFAERGEDHAKISADLVSLLGEIPLHVLTALRWHETILPKEERAGGEWLWAEYFLLAKANALTDEEGEPRSGVATALRCAEQSQ